MQLYRIFSVILSVINVYQVRFLLAICVNRSVLHRVDVAVHELRTNTRENFAAVNFHLLDGYQIIDVTRANVSVLCEGMVRNFPRLEHLSMINVHLEQIEPGAFQQVSRLTHLSLSVNRLKELVVGAFRNLNHLRVLYLSGNQLEAMEAGVFDDTPDLRKIYLDRNYLAEIDSGWFAKNPFITTIDMSHNRLSRIQTGAFILDAENQMDVEILVQNNEVEVVDVGAITSNGDGQSGEQENDTSRPHLLLHLEHNRLEHLEAGCVESLMVDTLHRVNVFLQDNRLQCLSNDLVSLLETHEFTLHVENNPLTCNCMAELDTVQRRFPKGALYFNSSSVEERDLCRFRVFQQTPARGVNWF